jgi:hypothetical protein
VVRQEPPRLARVECPDVNAWFCIALTGVQESPATKKQRELNLFHQFARAYPQKGDVDHNDRPDFRIYDNGAQRIIGIEVTELFQESGITGLQRQEVGREALN